MYKIIAAASLALVLAAGTAFGFSDNFDSYQTGALSSVSGGVWQTWNNNSADTTVTTGGIDGSNAMKNTGGGQDIVGYWDNAFATTNSVKCSFSFFVHETPGAESDIDTDTYLYYGSGTPGNAGIDYDSAIGNFIVDWYNTPGKTTLHIWDQCGAGGGGDYGIIELATDLSLDTWHNVDLVATLAVADPTSNDVADADGYFDVAVDGTTVLTHQYFGLNNPLGLNAVEIASYQDDNTTDNDYILLDNISVTAVPEPGSLMALATGLAGLAGFVTRRRK